MCFHFSHPHPQELSILPADPIKIKLFSVIKIPQSLLDQVQGMNSTRQFIMAMIRKDMEGRPPVAGRPGAPCKTIMLQLKSHSVRYENTLLLPQLTKSMRIFCSPKNQVSDMAQNDDLAESNTAKS